MRTSIVKDFLFQFCVGLVLIGGLGVNRATAQSPSGSNFSPPTGAGAAGAPAAGAPAGGAPAGGAPAGGAPPKARALCHQDIEFNPAIKMDAQSNQACVAAGQKASQAMRAAETSMSSSLTAAQSAEGMANQSLGSAAVSQTAQTAAVGAGSQQTAIANNTAAVGKGQFATGQAQQCTVQAGNVKRAFAEADAAAKSVSKCMNTAKVAAKFLGCANRDYASPATALGSKCTATMGQSASKVGDFMKNMLPYLAMAGLGALAGMAAAGMMGGDDEAGEEGGGGGGGGGGESTAEGICQQDANFKWENGNCVYKKEADPDATDCMKGYTWDDAANRCKSDGGDDDDDDDKQSCPTGFAWDDNSDRCKVDNSGESKVVDAPETGTPIDAGGGLATADDADGDGIPNDEDEDFEAGDGEGRGTAAFVGGGASGSGSGGRGVAGGASGGAGGAGSASGSSGGAGGAGGGMQGNAAGPNQSGSGDGSETAYQVPTWCKDPTKCGSRPILNMRGWRPEGTVQ